MGHSACHIHTVVLRSANRAPFGPNGGIFGDFRGTRPPYDAELLGGDQELISGSLERITTIG